MLCQVLLLLYVWAGSVDRTMWSPALLIEHQIEHSVICMIWNTFAVTVIVY